MRKFEFKFKDAFAEVVNEVRDGKYEEPECVNRVQKEAYICKKMKISTARLHEICIATGIDTMYDTLREKSGAAR